MPYRAFRRTLTATYFAPFIIALMVLAAVVLWRVQIQASITGWIEHSDQVLLTAKDAELELRNLQSASRDYLVAPDQRFLSDLTEARSKLAKNLSELVSLVADNPEQEEILARVTEAKEAWLDAVERQIAEARGGPISPQAINQVQPQAEALANSLHDFIVAERQLRAQRAAAQKASYRVFFVLVPLLSILVMAVPQLLGMAPDSSCDQPIPCRRWTGPSRARAEAEKASLRAEKASRTKDNFLGTVSHELRNPLNSILLWSTALLRDQSLGEHGAAGSCRHRARRSACKAS